jgi:hypothetical protein
MTLVVVEVEVRYLGRLVFRWMVVEVVVALILVVFQVGRAAVRVGLVEVEAQIGLEDLQTTPPTEIVGAEERRLFRLVLGEAERGRLEHQLHLILKTRLAVKVEMEKVSQLSDLRNTMVAEEGVEGLALPMMAGMAALAAAGLGGDKVLQESAALQILEEAAGVVAFHLEEYKPRRGTAGRGL